MSKRRTRQQKIRAGYRVRFSELKNVKKGHPKPKNEIVSSTYFRADLTKVLILTMLALALEFALWLIWKR